MSKIIYLNGAEPDGPPDGGLPTRAANPALVRYLRLLLEDAERGELVGVAVVPRGADGTNCYALVGEVGGYSMSGALHCLMVHLAHLNMSTASDLGADD